MYGILQMSLIGRRFPWKTTLTDTPVQLRCASCACEPDCCAGSSRTVVGCMWVPILIAFALNLSIGAPSVVVNQIATMWVTTLPLVLFTVYIHYISRRLKDT